MSSSDGVPTRQETVGTAAKENLPTITDPECPRLVKRQIQQDQRCAQSQSLLGGLPVELLDRIFSYVPQRLQSQTVYQGLPSPGTLLSYEGRLRWRPLFALRHSCWLFRNLVTRFSHSSICLNLADWIEDGLEITSGSYVRPFVDTITVIIDKETEFRVTTDDLWEHTIQIVFHQLEKYNRFNFLLRPDHCTGTAYIYMLALIVAWLKSNTASIALALKDIPLYILRLATKFVPQWATELSELRELILRVDESNTADQNDEEFRFLGKLVQQIPKVETLSIILRSSTRIPVQRLFKMPKQHLSSLESFTLYDVTVETSDFRRFIKLHADQLQWLHLECVNLENGDWRAMFEFMGDCKLAICDFLVQSLYDQSGTWATSYESRLEGSGQQTNLCKLEEWMRSGGESFPFNDLSVLSNDGTLTYEGD